MALTGTRFPGSEPVPAVKVVKVYGPRGPKGLPGDRGPTGTADAEAADLGNAIVNLLTSWGAN
jgi:hypothetical protein